MKIKIFALLIVVFTLTSCGDGKNKEDKPTETSTKEGTVEEPIKEEVTSTSEEVDLNAPTLENKGIGPVKSLTLDAIDENLAKKGKEVYKINCTACHKFKKRVVGPGLKGVTKRRSPEWIMNMILNPEEMVEKDPVAKALLAKYLSPMANQSLSEEDARSILEYFRLKDK